jgi:hypothetical protein
MPYQAQFQAMGRRKVMRPGGWCSRTAVRRFRQMEGHYRVYGPVALSLEALKFGRFQVVGRATTALSSL